MADDAVRRYLGLPYRIVLSRDDGDEDAPWRATVEELAGCEVRGSTPADAAARVPAALADWVATAQAEGREVPEPKDARNYSGKLLLRMSKTLHADLAQAAERDEVSLNAYINYMLATALQQPSPYTGPASPVWEESQPMGHDSASSTARLQRFLAIALAANVAVAAIVAAVAVILLLTAA